MTVGSVTMFGPPPPLFLSEPAVPLPAIRRAASSSALNTTKSASIMKTSRFCPIGDAQSQRHRRAAGTWTSGEDQLLSRLVERYGDRAWVKVAEGFKGVRDKKQCRERWYNHVDPKINNAPFSTEENAFIMDFYIRHGRQWAKMSRTDILAGRPDNSIKNHFNTNLMGHYLDLCHEFDMEPRQSSTNEVAVSDAVTASIRSRLAVHSSINGRGSKASRFLTPASCIKIENMITPHPSINQRRKRANTLQHISTQGTEEEHSGRTSASSTPSNATYSNSIASPAWRPHTSLGANRFSSHPSPDRDQQSATSTSSLLLSTQPLSRPMRLPLIEGAFAWTSERHLLSPSVFGTPTNVSPTLLSPSVYSELSLGEYEERTPNLTDRFTRWCNADGQYCLPPLNGQNGQSVSPSLGRSPRFQVNLPEARSVDEQHKAILGALEGRNLHSGQRRRRSDSYFF